jgi:hypothetical protein
MLLRPCWSCFRVPELQLRARREGVLLINLLEVAAEEDEGFILAWERARDFLSVQDGYRFDESSSDYWFLDALDLVGRSTAAGGR